MNKEEVFVFLESMKSHFSGLVDSRFEKYLEKAEKWVSRQRSDDIDSNKVYEKLASLALEFVDIDSGIFEYVASYPFVKGLYVQASKNRGYDLTEGPYGNYYDLVVQLSNIELPGGYTVYNNQILNSYSEEEILLAGSFIKPERDLLFKYIGIFMLADRYLATPKRGDIYELPQERFLTIAMVLMQNETIDRMSKVEEAYWAMSNLYMTVATPTLSNAGKSSGQLSSCFPPETFITTKDGRKMIKDISVGDIVLTHDGTFKPVTDLFIRNESESLLGLSFVGHPKELRLTKEHPVLVVASKSDKRVENRLTEGVTQNINWVKAGDLKKGDFVVVGNKSLEPSDIINTRDGNYSYSNVDGYMVRKIKSITKYEYNNNVYNLEVEDNHTYVAEGIVVHNCFIDVMDDSIDGIYGTNHDTARVSKAGGGQGIYIGKVRGLGASIQGRHGVSSGTVPWIRLLNQTAVSVDQLG